MLRTAYQRGSRDGAAESKEAAAKSELVISGSQALVVKISGAGGETGECEYEQAKYWDKQK
jgi:hypothetical protein